MNVPGWDVALHGLCLKPAGLKKMTFLSPNLCFFFSNQLKQPLRSLVESMKIWELYLESACYGNFVRPGFLVQKWSFGEINA